MVTASESMLECLTAAEPVLESQCPGASLEEAEFFITPV